MLDTNMMDAVDERNPKAEVRQIGENRFIVEPLERGYGITLGNSLRRVLLSSLMGAAVTHIHIEGVLHEFSTIPGVKEDTTEIILNLKKLRLRIIGGEEKVLRIEASGVGEVTAADIIADPEVEILNPELKIATLTDEKSRLVMDMSASLGTGYVPAEKQFRQEQQSIGTIPIDSIFSPVVRVNYEVQDTRVGQRTDYDRLVLEVETDGSIKPCEAVANAAVMLQERLDLFTRLQAQTEGVIEQEQSPAGKDGTCIEDLELSVRSLNCLKRAGIIYLSDLLNFSETQLMKLKNFGQKSLDEIEGKLSERGLSLRPSTPEGLN